MHLKAPINYITYRLSKSLNNGQTEQIEVSASIESEAQAEETLLHLQSWTQERMQVRETVAKLNSRKEQLQNEIYNLERDVTSAKKKWQEVKDFLEKMGITNIDDIPF